MYHTDVNVKLKLKYVHSQQIMYGIVLWGILFKISKVTSNFISVKAI